MHPVSSRHFRACTTIPIALLSLVLSPCSEGRADDASRLAPLVALLGRVDEAAIQKDVLVGILQAMDGKRAVDAPTGWGSVSTKLLGSADADVRARATQLAVLFGDPRAMASLLATLKDVKADAAARGQALQTLLPRRDLTLLPVLFDLLDDAAVRGPAIRALAVFGDLTTPERLIAVYANCTDAEKQDVVSTLSTRPGYALALLDAVEAKRVPSRDLSTFTIRQIAGLKHPKVSEKLTKAWGTIRPTAGDKAVLIAEYRSQLSDEALKKADRSRGRVVYVKICANCHKLFDEGRVVGPDLTGSQRRNVEYVLENLLDPSAVVGRDYQMTTLQTKDGRVITGIVKLENDNAVTLLTERDQVVVSKEDVEERKQQPVSLMPEGILQKLTPEEVRNLMAYVTGEAQAPLP